MGRRELNEEGSNDGKGSVANRNVEHDSPGCVRKYGVGK